MQARRLEVAAETAEKALLAVATASGAGRLERLRALQRLRDDLDQIMAAAVQQAIDGGESWRGIGDATGLTKAGAHRRWAARLAESRRSARPNEQTLPF